MDPSRKRGPRGLGSSRVKKQKVEDVQPDTTAVEETTTSSETKTIALQGDFADDDELGELKALYQTAVSALNKKDILAAAPIINGTIHEADRMLRNSQDRTAFPFEFYRIYAGALLDLSLLIEEDRSAGSGSRIEFIERALEWCDNGLESAKDPGHNALKLTQARCLCQQIQYHLAHGDSPDLQDTLTQVKKAIQLVDDAFKVSHYKPLQLNQTLLIIQDFADSLLDISSEHETINKWAESIWTKVLTADQEDVSALEGCGRVWLSLAQPSIMLLETTSEAEKEMEKEKEVASTAREALETSLELLTQALKCAEQQDMVHGDLLCLLAEVTISMANTFDEGPHYDKLEYTTYGYLERAEALEGFELPLRFQEMLKPSTVHEESGTDTSEQDPDLPHDGQT